MKKQTKFIFFIIILVIIVGGIGVFASQDKLNKGSELIGFAQCISDSGAKFYGAFWCSHCQSQKEMFGSAKKYLPYVECSSADGNRQLEICKEAGIEGYPTWVFADGSSVPGELSLKALSERTQCELPVLNG